MNFESASQRFSNCGQRPIVIPRLSQASNPEINFMKRQSGQDQPSNNNIYCSPKLQQKFSHS